MKRLKDARLRLGAYIPHITGVDPHFQAHELSNLRRRNEIGIHKDMNEECVTCPNKVINSEVHEHPTTQTMIVETTASCRATVCPSQVDSHRFSYSSTPTHNSSEFRDHYMGAFAPETNQVFDFMGMRDAFPIKPYVQEQEAPPKPTKKVNKNFGTW